MDWLTTVGLLLSAMGLIGTAFGLQQAKKQLKQSQKIAMGEFLLNLDDKFIQHKETHIALRAGGKWATNDEAPMTAAEWSQVEIYMGLFERINILIDKGILDIDTVNSLYGYRVANIVANPTIKEKKLVENAENWSNFISLCRRLYIQIK